jgi:signal peptidase I
MANQLNTIQSTISKPDTINLLEDILKNDLSLRVKVTGRSMAPFLLGGEVLTIKKVPYESLRKGDLIFFKNHHGVPLIHLIIKKGTNSVQTKGDALLAFDEPVLEQDVLGKVCMIEKIVAHGDRQSINIASFIWRKTNFVIAIMSVIKSKAYCAIRRIYRIKHSVIHQRFRASMQKFFTLSHRGR